MGPLEKEIGERIRAATLGHPAGTRALVEGDTTATPTEKLDMAWRCLDVLAESMLQVARRLDGSDEAT